MGPDSDIVSTTPDGSPRPGFVPLGQSASAPSNNVTTAAQPQQDTSAILEALKNMAKQNAAAAPAPVATPASLNNLLGTQTGTPQPTSTVNPGPAPVGANGHAVNPLGALLAGMNNGAQSQSPANVPQNPLAAFLPQPQAPVAVPQNPAPINPDAQTQLQLLQLLAAQGVPPDQWATALQLLNLQNASGGANTMPFPPPAQANNWAGPQSRDATTRSPPGQYRRRSRSPGFDRRRDLSPRRHRDSPGADQFRNDRDGRRDYRQRSPPGRRRRSPSPPAHDTNLPPPGPKMITFDRSLPKGHIKVYSRTLFVGGVTFGEATLRPLFSKFGVVQTCIVNVDKRHAFIKMINRRDAESARHGMEEYKIADTQLRVSNIHPECWKLMTDTLTYRPNGVSDSDHVTAVTMPLALVSFPLSDSQKPIANGCSRPNMAVQVVYQSKNTWLWKSLTLRLVPVSRQKVWTISFCCGLHMLTRSSYEPSRSH